MATNDEKRRVAAELRESIPDGNFSKGEKGWSVLYLTIFGHYMLNQRSAMTYREVASRLADLIEPTDGFDLDTVQRVCFECMEGCDEPEWTLYTTIHDAIARYKRGESVPTYDRDALLALADEMDAGANYDYEITHAKSAREQIRRIAYYARRIREALGVER